MLDDEMMAKLLDDGWEHNRVPKPQEISSKHKRARAVTSTKPSLGAWMPSMAGFLAGVACTALAFRLAQRA